MNDHYEPAPLRRSSQSNPTIMLGWVIIALMAAIFITIAVGAHYFGGGR
jgi:hypothetical protein